MALPRNRIAPDGEGPPDDRLALDDLFSAAYEELRRLASSVRRGDPGATLSPTALVNEAWLKLAGSPDLALTSRLHFKRKDLIADYEGMKQPAKVARFKTELAELSTGAAPVPNRP
jgi:hypothetical protein